MQGPIRPTSRRRLPGRAPYVVSALRRKYAELKGREDAEAMAHVGATLRLFSPAEDLAAIPAVRPYKAERERWSRTALSILRTAEKPLRARELARLVMVAHGVDPTDQARLVSISCGLQAVLRRLADQGVMAVSGKPRRWALALAECD